jgi:HORMA domain-containing protein
MTASATSTSVVTLVYVATHFTDKMLLLLGNIIRESGLSMTYFTSNRATLERGIKTWLLSGHLRKVTLEVFKPGTQTLIQRWDLDWDKCDAAETLFWVDVVDIRYHIKKTGVIPSTCGYNFLVDTAPGHPAVAGWGTGTYADTSGLKQYSLGTTISGGGYGSRTTYYK